MAYEITATNAPQYANEWNDAIRSSQYGTFYQTTYYADYAKTVGLEPLYITGGDKGEPCVRLVIYRTSPAGSYALRLPFSGLMTRVARAALPALIWRYGPVLHVPQGSKQADEALVELAKWIAKYAQRTRAPVSSGTPHPLSDLSSPFTQNGFTAKPWGTFLIDLSKPKEELWKNVDKAARKLIERTAERGVRVREVTSADDLQAYTDVVNDSRRRAGVTLYPASPRFWHILRENNVGAVLLAEKDGDVLAGLTITWFNGYVNEWGAGTSQKAIDEKLYAGDLLKWHVIESGAKAGHRYYDLTGVNPEPKDDKEAGILRFKAKYGGELVKYSEFSLKVPRQRDLLIKLGKRLRR